MTKVKRRRPGFGPRGSPDGSQGWRLCARL